MKPYFMAFTLFFLIIFLSSCQIDSSQNQPKENMNPSISSLISDSTFLNQHKLIDKLPNISGIGQVISFSTPSGNNGTGYFIPSKVQSDQYLFVFHEWWGLNNFIKRKAEEYHLQFPHIHVLALDLYDGQVAQEKKIAANLMENTSEFRITDIIYGALDFAGSEPQIVSVGWCFGGGWSLRSAIFAGDSAIGCVMYYGLPTSTEELVPLQTDVLGIFASKDKWITKELIDKFSDSAKALGKSFYPHWFNAEHAFANPSSPRYSKDEALQADELVYKYLKSKFTK